MDGERKLPKFWLLRRLRRWIVKPQKEIDRWQRRWKSSPIVALPKFLHESRKLLELILKLKPDIVLGNARSGSPYVLVIERHLKSTGIEVRYERLCSAWGHKLLFSLKPAASIHWLHQALAQRKRIVMVDVSRKPFSDAQRIVAGVAVWLYNEATSYLTGTPQPQEFVPSVTKQMRDYLRRQPNFKEALDEVCGVVREALETGKETGVVVTYAKHLLVCNLDGFEWDERHGCLLPINISRKAWIDDRTDKYAWLPIIARWFI